MNHTRFGFLFLALSLCLPLFSRADSLDLSTGYYVYSKDKKSVSEIGGLQLDFTKKVTQKLSVSPGLFYAVGVSGIDSSLWGISLPVNYCVFGCRGVAFSDPAGLVSFDETENWAFELGAGFAQRTFNPDSSTLTLLGPMGRAQLIYRPDTTYQLFARYEHLYLTSSGGNVRASQINFGLSIIVN